MTTNKPKVVAWIWDHRGRHMATTDYSKALELAEPPYPTEVEPLIRLADYQRLQVDHERLQAECEKLKSELDGMSTAAQHESQAADHFKAECEKLRNIISDLKDWDCDVSAGFLSIPLDLRRRMQEAIDTATQEPSHENQ